METAMFKYNLTDRELEIVQDIFRRKKKSLLVAWLLWFFTGLLGGHRFYLGDRNGGLLILLTIGGFLGLLWVVDAFTLYDRTRKVNDSIETNIIIEIINRRRLKEYPGNVTGWKKT